jgi:transcriptional regulator with XRE-family HTH domain
MTTKKTLDERHNDTITFLEELTGGKQTLGRLLSSIRKGEELTQEEFAKMLKISKQNLSDIENNRRPVSLSKAVDFASKLGYPPDGFMRLALQDLADREGVKGYRIIVVKEVNSEISTRRKAPLSRTITKRAVVKPKKVATTR